MAREFNNSNGKGKGKGKGRDTGDRGTKGEKKEEKPQNKVVYMKIPVSATAPKSTGKSYLDMLKTSSNPPAPAAPVEKAAPAAEAPKADPTPVEAAKPTEPKPATPEVVAIQQPKAAPIEPKPIPAVEPKKTIVASQPILPVPEKDVTVAKVVKELLDDETELPAVVAETLLADNSGNPWGDLTGAPKSDDMRPKFAAPTTPTTSPTSAPPGSSNPTSKRFHEQSESVVLPCGFEAPQTAAANFQFRASDDRPVPRQMGQQPAIHPTSAATTSSAPQQAQPPQQPQHQKPQGGNISAGPHSIHQQHQQFDSIDKDHQHHHHQTPQGQQPQQQQGRMHWGQGAQGAGGAPKAPHQAFPKFSQGGAGSGAGGGAVHPPVSQSQSQPPPSNWSQHKSHQPQQPLAMLQQFSKSQPSVSQERLGSGLGSAEQLRLYEQRMQLQQHQQQQKNPMAGRSSGKGQYGGYPSPSQYSGNYSSGMGFPSSYGSAQQSGYGGQYGGFGGYSQYGNSSYTRSEQQQLFNKNISGYSQQQQQQQQQQPQQYWGGGSRSNAAVDYYQGSRSLWAGSGGAPSNR